MPPISGRSRAGRAPSSVAHRRPSAPRRPREERREGRRFAQLFRKHRGLPEVRCCDLDAILDDDEIVVVDSDSSNPGFVAALLRNEGVSGILLAKGQTGGRRRFSIAHELGHFHIPTHQHVNGACQESDFTAGETSSAVIEWEANDFAAELLMPFRLFSADSDARPIAIGSAIELSSAAFYDVSIIAAALRMVQTTRHPAALVVSANGRVSWMTKSESFKWWLPEPGKRLHNDSLGAATYRRVEESPDALPVPFDAWFDRSRPARGELLESTYRIDSQEQIVSLLWHVDGDDDVEED